MRVVISSSPSVRIGRLFIRHPQKKRHWKPWSVLLKNGAKNIRIPWKAGNSTGMPFLRFSSFQRLSERLSIRLIPLKAWMQHTGNWTVSAVFFQVTQHCWKPSICPPLKQRKNGVCPFGTGDRSMVNWALCTKADYRNKRIHLSFTGGFSACSWHAAIVVVINKTRAEHPKRYFQPSYIIEDRIYRLFFTHSLGF